MSDGAILVSVVLAAVGARAYTGNPWQDGVAGGPSIPATRDHPTESICLAGDISFWRWSFVC